MERGKRTQLEEMKEEEEDFFHQLHEMKESEALMCTSWIVSSKICLKFVCSFHVRLALHIIVYDKQLVKRIVHL